MTDSITLWYENEIGNHRKIHRWEKLSDAVVRWYQIEVGYHYPNDQWQEDHCHYHDYEIDESGRLVGDGSGWDGANERWQEWAVKRFHELCEIRFPHDFTDEPSPMIEEVAKDLIEANY